MIDDDVDDLEMFSSELKLKGIKVIGFESSAKAFVYLHLMSEIHEPPSMIILDYNMPKKNGHEVLLSLKHDTDTKDIPVVLYSTSISELLRKQLLSDGASDCFIKPWTYHGFVSQVVKFQGVEVYS